MAEKRLRVDIAEIAHTLKMKKNNNQSMVLFLGSRAGALFRSEPLYEFMKPYSTRSFDNLSDQERFVECYKLLRQGRFGEREIHSILAPSLQEKAAIEVNICLANLVKQDLFDIIVSTNVDTFLEKAFKETEMKEHHDFAVIDPKRDALHDFIYSDKRLSCKVIKTFGDFDSREYNVAKRDFYLDSIPDLKSILENILARDVLVIGFDPTWDEEMIRAFPAGKGSLWLVMEEDVSTRHPLVSLAKHGRPVKCITGKMGNCEQFLKALYWHLYEKMPVNYQLVHDTLRELEALHNKLNQLERIHSDVQAVHKELLHLKKKWGHCLDNTRENVTLTNDC